jgi:hypothetical protein
MTVYTFDDNIVSDLHKDARGYRPRELFWAEWNTCDDFDRQAIWDGLLRELSQTMERQRHEENIALIALHQRVQGMMLIGATSEVQAMKWILEAEEFSDFDLQYGPSYVAFHFGINYKDVNEFPIQEAINEMLSEVV